jgi:hypothetical protein
MTVAQSSKRRSVGSKASKARHARIVEPFSLDEPRYLLGQVAFAAGISSTLLKAWVVRKIIPMGEHDREAHGKGSSRVFTLRRALSVALAAEMVKLGVSARFAGQMGSSGIHVALEKAGDNALKIDDLIALYPMEAGTSFRGANWNYTIKTMIERNAPPDEEIPSSFVVLNLKGIALKVLQRLGELEKT